MTAYEIGQLLGRGPLGELTPWYLLSGVRPKEVKPYFPQSSKWPLMRSQRTNNAVTGPLLFMSVVAIWDACTQHDTCNGRTVSPVQLTTNCFTTTPMMSQSVSVPNGSEPHQRHDAARYWPQQCRWQP
jgi:hypothetical protein